MPAKRQGPLDHGVQGRSCGLWSSCIGTEKLITAGHPVEPPLVTWTQESYAKSLCMLVCLLYMEIYCSIRDSTVT